ncbi:MAG TPA: GNAT family N-acetyltransferase [Acidimicrobiales bacterium]|nr:GNAT family N-acetyltransferase [Acidimicrobiales bacterium]
MASYLGVTLRVNDGSYRHMLDGQVQGLDPPALVLFCRAVQAGRSVNDFEVRDDPAAGRLTVEYDGLVAELIYEKKDGKLVILHTGVPEEMAGHGVGGRLVAQALSIARDDDLTVVPHCPFARRWLHEHPDVASTVTIDWAASPS